MSGSRVTRLTMRDTMKEIRIHGRGGQGSLVLAQFMAIAALENGKYGQAFPFLGGGGERRGKPIMAFCRLDDKPIRVRSRITEPHYVIVQDATILKEVDVEEGLRADGVVLINTDQGRYPAQEILGAGVTDQQYVVFSKELPAQFTFCNKFIVFQSQ